MLTVRTCSASELPMREAAWSKEMFVQARWKGDAADFSSGFIILPSGAGNVAADNTFDGKRLRLAHNHGAAREIVAICVEGGGEVRGAENVVRDDILQ